MPSGCIRVEAGISPSERRTRHGVVVYDRPLTQDEIESYELHPYMPLAEVVDRIVSGMKYAAKYAEIVREEGDEAIRPNVGDALDRKLPIYTDVPLDEVHKHAARELLRRFPEGAKNNPRPGKYADVKAKYGARGFAFPEKAPYVGSFPVYPIGRARYALAIVAAPTYDHKQSEREKVIAAVKAAYPRDVKITAEIATVRARVASRIRAVANPRHRRNGPTMDMPHYPRTEKESIYLVLSDKELRESLKDAQSALKKAVENAKKGKGFPSAPKWYADDVQTILAELNRRGIR